MMKAELGTEIAEGDRCEKCKGDGCDPCNGTGLTPVARLEQSVARESAAETPLMRARELGS